MQFFLKRDVRFLLLLHFKSIEDSAAEQAEDVGIGLEKEEETSEGSDTHRVQTIRDGDLSMGLFGGEEVKTETRRRNNGRQQLIQRERDSQVEIRIFLAERE